MDGGFLRNQYAEVKQRNEETLAHMQRLEHELARVKAEIREKKLRSLFLRSYHQTCTQRTLRLAAYHELLSSIDPNDKQQEALSRDRVDQLCKQLEETLLTRRVERVPHDMISQDPASLVDAALSQITALLSNPPPCPVTQLLSSMMIQRPPGLPSFLCSDDHGNSTKTFGIHDAKYNEMLKRVHDRVRHVYPDLRIQTAVFECIQAKAECLGSAAELEAMKQAAEEWQVHATRGDGQTREENKDGKTLEALVDSVAQKQRRIYQLMASNRVFPHRIESQRQQLADYAEQQAKLADRLVKICHGLVGTIRNHLDAFHRAPLAPDSINFIQATPDGTRLGQIKDALHPYLELSREGAIQSLTDTITRVNTLAHSKQPELRIRGPLESLAERWNNDLMENGVQLPETLQSEDSVDLIVQSAKAYKDYVKQRQDAFLAEEEARIKPQFQKLDRAEKSVYEVVDAIEERKYFEDGSIAMEYTYEDKTFAEWMDVVFSKHAEKRS